MIWRRDLHHTSRENYAKRNWRAPQELRGKVRSESCESSARKIGYELRFLARSACMLQ